MEEILNQLIIMNETLSNIVSYQSLILSEIKEIKGDDLYNSISDVCDKLYVSAEEIKGNGLYNNLSDVCGKLDEINSQLTSIESTVLLKD